MGGGSTTVENDYDDQWIKDWHSDAEGKADHFQGMIDNLTQWNQDRIGEINQNTGNIANLTDWNADRMEEIKGINTRTDTNTANISDLLTKYNTLTTKVGKPITQDDLGEEFGNVISGLKEYYGDDGFNLATTDDLFSDTDFTESMNKRLTALGAQLNEAGELTGFKSFDKFDPTALQNLIEAAEGDITTLQGQFSGLSKDLVDDEGNAISVAEALAGQKQGLIDKYDLGNLDTRFEGLDELISGEDGTGGITGQISDIFGDIGGLGTRASDLETAIGSDVEGEESGILGSLAGLKSGLATGLESSAKARDTLRDTLLGKIGTLGVDEEGNQISLSESLTKGLEGITSDYTKAITSSETGLTNLLRGERGEAIDTAKSELADQYGLGTLQDDLSDIYTTREQAIEDLTGDFAGRLQTQEQELSTRIDEQDKAFDEKIGRLGSMMNYRMLGDSAGGIKMRRSKAYKSGAVNTGTGQLSRNALKINTLNI
jgi:hypothetical protein